MTQTVRISAGMSFDRAEAVVMRLAELGFSVSWAHEARKHHILATRNPAGLPVGDEDLPDCIKKAIGIVV